MSPVDGYVFRQCPEASCRFRYPDRGDRATATCPRCGTAIPQATAVATQPAPELAAPTPRPSLHALLDNIRSLHNVGSIFRTAEGAGIAHLHLAGMTGTPDNPRLAKTALGAERRLPWTAYNNSLDAAATLAGRGMTLWAIEGGPGAVSLFDVKRPVPDDLVLVVGHERAGIDPALQIRCALTVAVPMLGAKRSLNVAVAFGIAVYWLRFGP